MKAESESKGYRRLLLILLWLLYACFGIVARSIFPLVTPILQDLRISYSEMGFILGSWQLTYILIALAAGTILDRWGVRKSIFAGASIMAASAAVRFYADTFFEMLCAVALFGVGGPMISIGGPKAISEFFRGRKRGTAMGIYTTGNWVGGFSALALTAGLVMPLVGNSWRLTFVCYGLTTFAVALLWLCLAKTGTSVPLPVGAGIIEVFRKLIGIRNVQVLLIMSLFAFAVGHGFSSWLPKILEENGMSASKAGLAASIVIATGIPSILLIPSLVAPQLRRHVIAFFALLTSINLILVMKISGTGLYTGLSMMGFTSSPFMPLMLLILMDNPEVEPKYMGSAGGMFFCVAEIGGFAGPLLMGIFADLTGTFMAGALFLASLCIGIALLTLFLNQRPPAELGV